MAVQRISMQGPWSAIRIGKGVIKTLGNPEYICLRVNAKRNVLAIRPCGPGDKMSFKVPPDLMDRKGIQFRIYSKQFVRSFLAWNGLSPDSCCCVDGEYSETDHAIFFDMSKLGKYTSL